MTAEIVKYCEILKSYFDNLLPCFRQLLDLFVSWDWATYFADFGKSESAKYQRVAPGTALCLLEKLKEADNKGSILGGINLNKKDTIHNSIVKNGIC